MLSQVKQSMTKAKPISNSTMDTGKSGGSGSSSNNSVVGGTRGGSAVNATTATTATSSTNATTNNSSTNSTGVSTPAVSSGGNSTATSTGRGNEPGSPKPNVYQSGTEHLPKLQSILPVVTQCTYTSCYCEENVWKMCDKVRSDFPSELDCCHVAFISNKIRTVPMWKQKAGKNEEKLALWDYHVILLYNPDDRCVVYDMDSDLPFPTHFHRYVSETFRTENILQPEYHRFFRIIPASRFLSLFSSDRTHMLKPDKSWLKPPPNYPPICNNQVNNLDKFIDMADLSNEYGDVFTLMELVRRFYKPRQLS